MLILVLIVPAFAIVSIVTAMSLLRRHPDASTVVRDIKLCKGSRVTIRNAKGRIHLNGRAFEGQCLELMEGAIYIDGEHKGQL